MEMDIPLRSHRFNGESSIKVLHFLARITNEAKIEGIFEIYAFVTLQ